MISRKPTLRAWRKGGREEERRRKSGREGEGGKEEGWEGGRRKEGRRVGGRKGRRKGGREGEGGRDGQREGERENGGKKRGIPRPPKNIGCSTKQILTKITHLPNECDNYQITCDPARNQRFWPVKREYIEIIIHMYYGVLIVRYSVRVCTLYERRGVKREYTETIIYMYYGVLIVRYSV